MTSSIGRSHSFCLECDKRKFLTQLLTKDYLKQNPKEALKEISSCLIHQNQETMDWEKIDPEVLEMVIALFLSQGTDEQLKHFVENHVCALDDADLFERLLYPNLTELFFKKIEGHEERLANLILYKPLVISMGLIKNGINRILLNAMYKKNPQDDLWNYIRKEVSRYSNLLYLRPAIWYLDIVALFEKPLAKEELEIQLINLLEDFDFYGNNDDLFLFFTIEFLYDHALLSEEKIHLLIQGMTRATSFTMWFREQCFITHALNLRTQFWEQRQQDCDSLIVPLLKGYVLAKAESPCLGIIAKELTTKEQLKAVLKALEACPEPWRTLHIGHLVYCLDKKKEALNEQRLEIPAEDMEAVFKEFQLAYKEFPLIDTELYQFAFSLHDYIESFQKIDSEEKLRNFWKKIKNTKQFSAWPDALVDGMLFPNKLILKPKLDKNRIKDFVVHKGWDFYLHNQPATLDQFLEEF